MAIAEAHKVEIFGNAGHGIMRSVAAQLMSGSVIELEGQKIKITRVGSGRLRIARFVLQGRKIEAIEQNRDKPSRWGQLAREKHQVVQFLDLATKKYLAVSVDGEITEYGPGLNRAGSKARDSKPAEFAQPKRTT